MRNYCMACGVWGKGLDGEDLRDKWIAAEGGGWVPEQSLVWGYGGPCDSGVLGEEGDGAVIVRLGAVSCGAGCGAQPSMAISCPPLLEIGVLVLSHHSPPALGTAPPDAGSSVFWGSPML